MTDRKLFAPDVIEKDGRYYLYAYIVGSKGVVGVSDKPEGPFKLLSQYKYDPEDAGDDGIYNDAGVLVDDDGRVYIYYGFTESNFNEIDPADMYTIKKGSYKRAVIDDSDNAPQEQRFFEASSPRKIGDTYYLIYSTHFWKKEEDLCRFKVIYSYIFPMCRKQACLCNLR